MELVLPARRACTGLSPLIGWCAELHGWRGCCKRACARTDETPAREQLATRERAGRR